MKDKQIERFLREIGVDHVEYRNGRWVGTCPFARWNHSGGTDTNPSFGVWRNRGGWARYNCFGCGEKGPLLGILWKLYEREKKIRKKAWVTGFDPWGEFQEEPKASSLDYRVGGSELGRANQRLQQHAEPLGVRPPRTGSSPSYKGNASFWPQGAALGRVEKEDPPTEKEIEVFKILPRPDYAKARGIDFRTYERWELGDDVKNKRLIFPCRDHRGNLVGYTGRLYWDKGYCFKCGTIIVDEERSKKKRHQVLMNRCPECYQPYMKYKHTRGKWRSSNVHGIHLWTEGKPAVLCEGSMDAIRRSMHGVCNAGSLFGASPSPPQMQLIASKVGKVFAMGDGDKAGRQMNKHVKDMMFVHGIEVVEVPLEEGVDPDGLSKEEVQALLPKSAFFDTDV